jgi:hypothetical protein
LADCQLSKFNSSNLASRYLRFRNTCGPAFPYHPNASTHGPPTSSAVLVSNETGALRGEELIVWFNVENPSTISVTNLKEDPRTLFTVEREIRVPGIFSLLCRLISACCSRIASPSSAVLCVELKYAPPLEKLYITRVWFRREIL